ncbi:hypothetical protein ACFO1B_27730 [Dactylosporangium siamense]|uniref:hypothetical protein n=1 Tax=Dactylosporangium siamense TaxID=685454 RepID=UPI003610B506
MIEVVHGLRGQPARDVDHQEDPLPVRKAGEAAAPGLGNAGSSAGHAGVVFLHTSKDRPGI